MRSDAQIGVDKIMSSWNQIPAIASLTCAEVLEMLQAMCGWDASDLDFKIEYMRKYAGLTEDERFSLGYAKCFVEASMQGFRSAYADLCMETYMSRQVPPMCLPLRFVGWAGVQNDIGPAYEITDSHFTHGTRFFYTDEDIEGSLSDAKRLAKRIARESSGLCNVRAEMISELKTMEDGDGQKHCAVTFALADRKRRELFVNGVPYQSTGQKNPPYVFVLAKAGEFNCILGEMVNGDPDSCFVLAKHQYCMK